ncbi:hypothetical protein HYX07_00595 [Candidatus Woesearchaeota archaeon]|nr:hypothetical protein [Candidatus Woesearchaeota archaeon]
MSHYSADIKQAEVSVVNYFQRAEGNIDKRRTNEFLNAFQKAYNQCLMYVDHYDVSGLRNVLLPEVRGEFTRLREEIKIIKRQEELRERIRKRIEQREHAAIESAYQKYVHPSLPESLGRAFGSLISTFNIEIPLEVFLGPEFQNAVISDFEFTREAAAEFLPNLQTAVQRRMKEPETQMEMEKWQKDVRLRLDMFMVKIYRILG